MPKSQIQTVGTVTPDRGRTWDWASTGHGAGIEQAQSWHETGHETRHGARHEAGHGLIYPR
ncbi:hypothetical protein [uncultured Cohaesibacter sp.]|uniref:hypothetical protein n=1 Tax=uncultured Cohaesibacter sp. TaxID=1002546 RepID=UPI00292D0288|nr:hypothetical protein [uncultured Cohaesibacter sp.]